MAFAQRLDLRQGQQLVMTPQLQQAIKMLQMSNLELRDYIVEELERNPLLEAADRQAGADGGVEEAGDRPSDAAVETRLERELADDRLARADETFDTGAENLYADEARADRMTEPTVDVSIDGPDADAVGRSLEASAWSTVGKGGSSRFDDADQSLDGVAGRHVTLREHLQSQLGASGVAPDLTLIVSDLIDQLDECGYLRIDLDEAAERLGAAPERLQEGVALLQGFDPTGVGATDLRDCLRLQLAERDRLDPAMAALLDNLDLLARRESAKLLRLCGVDLDDLKDMIAEIRALDPKPGLRFETEVTLTISPDVFVYENRENGWSVELNGDTLPRLLLNNSYASEVRRAAQGDDGEVKEFLAECHQNANWLLKSIDQRAKTILRVASEIVRQQDGFLAYGVSALRPLNLKAVAEAIDMHESTVSRVTSNKYMATPRGVFEMKYFFTPAIASMDGTVAYSAEAIRHRIKTLIDGEPADDVLSDDRIVAVLREAGVDIARRTVAKYREALKIPSSVQRRKLKSADNVI